MTQDKVKVKLSGISASMLGCLWGRAQLSTEYSSLFYDAEAVELVERIDYDFSASDVPSLGIMLNIICKGNLLPMFIRIALVAKQFDDKIKTYITKHPQASVVNLGAGLDTTFYRIDNGLIHWYDLDLPAVIAIRRQLLPEPDRVTSIAKSLLDPSWCKDINTEHGVFLIAEAVFQYFKESEMKQFFSMLADNFPDGEIVFTMPQSEEGFRELMDMFPPEQRDAMRAALMEGVKEWWEKAPQDEKEKAITALKTPTKPKGTEWSDLQAWWEKLYDAENAEALRDLMSTFSHMSSERGDIWAPKDGNEIAKWDSRITVVDQFSWSRNIPRDSLSAEIRRIMEYHDEKGKSNIIHLRV
jgi:O-methyltransferase involved in polyketide biosynthesis